MGSSQIASICRRLASISAGVRGLSIGQQLTSSRPPSQPSTVHAAPAARTQVELDKAPDQVPSKCGVVMALARPSVIAIEPAHRTFRRIEKMRIGIGIGEIGGRPAGIDDLIAQTKRAEQDGFATGWFANIFGIDALTAVALVGRETSRIALGTAVVPTFPRHPVVMAQQALTTQAATGGRFSLGIGLSHQIVIEFMLGMSFAKPFSHMKEYLAVLSALIRTGNASHQGTEYRVNANVAVPGATACPILLAALAPKMLALAGSEADGTITWMTGPKTLREHTIPRINDAAAKAGRPAPRVVVGLPICVTKEIAAAREIAGRAFQIYGGLPSYRAMLDREGVEGPADVAIVGDEDAVGEQLQHLSTIGVGEFLAAPFPVGADAEGSLARTRALLIRLASAAGQRSA
jgi:5,10-methylenetetrahydromethanopterin reductase